MFGRTDMRKGFTLLEMLLVMVIISLLILLLVGYMQQRTAAVQITRTSMQMQVILNAGLAYYRNNAFWPQDLDILQNDHYLSEQTLVNPWGEPYQINGDNHIGILTVNTVVPDENIAVAVAGRIPMGTYTATSVTGLVTVPPEDLNSARAVNFASVYHSGACVPVPQCPLKMKPQIFILPVSVYGVTPTSNPSNPTCTPDRTDPSHCTFEINPLHGITVWAIGPVDLSTSNGAIPACETSITIPEAVKCYQNMSINSSGSPQYSGVITNGTYWRICLNNVTRLGSITQNWLGSSGVNSALFGTALGSMLAITKCVPVNEEVGSSYNVWSY